MARNTVADAGYSTCVAVTLSDTVDISTGVADALQVTTAGNIVIVDPNGNVVTLTACPVTTLRIKVARVNSTGTTATAAALYY